MSALEQFYDPDYADDLAKESPIERLRFFLSFGLNGQDWLDVEQFIDAISSQLEAEKAAREKAEGLHKTAMQLYESANNRAKREKAARVKAESDLQDAEAMNLTGVQAIMESEAFKLMREERDKLQAVLDGMEPVAWMAHIPQVGGTYSVRLQEEKHYPIGVSWQEPLYRKPEVK